MFSMLLRKCRVVNLLIPNIARNHTGGEDEVGYEGATVIDPKKGFYNEPIATLDFASLYPSIIQGYNLCYSTLVAPADRAKLTEDQYKASPRDSPRDARARFWRFSVAFCSLFRWVGVVLACLVCLACQACRIAPACCSMTPLRSMVTVLPGAVSWGRRCRPRTTCL